MGAQPIPPRQRIFLLGFMGAGKTTIGRDLAQRLGWTFTDLDQTIEAREQRSIPEIFAQEGEPFFRRREQAALQEVLARTTDNPAVIALGGGTLAQPGNRDLIRQASGVTVWLDCPIEELQHRCQGENHRPLFRDSACFQQLYQQRLPFYQKADFRVDASSSNPISVVEEILRCLPF